MKSAGVEFVILKATDFNWKSGIDDRFFGNFKKAKDASLLVGAYHWWICDSKFNVVEQVGLMKMYLSSILKDLDLPISLDVEVGGTPKALWTSRLYATISEIKDWTARKPIIYTSNGIWKGNAIYPIPAFAECPLWIAHYKVQQPTIPSPWTYFTIWQYACTFTDPVAKNSENFGINKYEGKALDTNWFNGTLNNLKAL